MEIKTLENKRIFISGSTDGIGRQTALEAAEQSAEVIIHGRNQERIFETIQLIKAHTGNEKIKGYRADFASLDEVYQMSKKIVNDFDYLDILMNNAGGIKQERMLTKDGLEYQFQVNYLSHFLLTEQLRPLLTGSKGSRIINTASIIHASSLDFDNLQAEKQYHAGTVYAMTKLLNILHTYSLAEELKDSETVVHCLHPGVIDTKLLRTARSGGASVKEGAANLLYAASSEVIGKNTGFYLENRRPMQSNPVSYDRSVQVKLRKLSKEFVKEYIS